MKVTLMIDGFEDTDIEAFARRHLATQAALQHNRGKKFPAPKTADEWRAYGEGVIREMIVDLASEEKADRDAAEARARSKQEALARMRGATVTASSPPRP